MPMWFTVTVLYAVKFNFCIQSDSRCGFCWPIRETIKFTFETKTNDPYWCPFRSINRTISIRFIFSSVAIQYLSRIPLSIFTHWMEWYRLIEQLFGGLWRVNPYGLGTQNKFAKNKALIRANITSKRTAVILKGPYLKLIVIPLPHIWFYMAILTKFTGKLL